MAYGSDTPVCSLAEISSFFYLNVPLSLILDLSSILTKSNIDATSHTSRSRDGAGCLLHGVGVVRPPGTMARLLFDVRRHDQG
jgi:hypothetical protein